MYTIEAEWYCVKDVFPAHFDWVIVRCINSDEDNDFYFMARYYKGIWEFFNDDDKKYENKMQVTHWMNTPDVPFNIRFNKK